MADDINRNIHFSNLLNRNLSFSVPTRLGDIGLAYIIYLGGKAYYRDRSTYQESVFWPDQEGFEFKPEFKPRDGERVIEKSVPCAFINSSLSDELKDKNIDRIVVVGVATDNSVEVTARTGGNMGFQVYLVE